MNEDKKGTKRKTDNEEKKLLVVEKRHRQFLFQVIPIEHRIRIINNIYKLVGISTLIYTIPEHGVCYDIDVKTNVLDRFDADLSDLNVRKVHIQRIPRSDERSTCNFFKRGPKSDEEFKCMIWSVSGTPDIEPEYGMTVIGDISLSTIESDPVKIGAWHYYDEGTAVPCDKILEGRYENNKKHGPWHVFLGDIFRDVVDPDKSYWRHDYDVYYHNGDHLSANQITQIIMERDFLPRELMLLWIEYLGLLPANRTCKGSRLCYTRLNGLNKSERKRIDMCPCAIYGNIKCTDCTCGVLSVVAKL